jgi:Family of unknown function (DUF6069)
MSTVAAGRAQGVGFGRLLLVGLLAGLAAGVLNVLVYFVGLALGVPFLMPLPPDQAIQQIPAVAFIMASVVPALLAAIFYGLLGRFAAARATSIFVIVSVVFALLSLGGSLTPPVELSTRLVLSLLHLTTAAIIVAGLVRFARQGR